VRKIIFLSYDRVVVAIVAAVAAAVEHIGSMRERNWQPLSSFENTHLWFMIFRKVIIFFFSFYLYCKTQQTCELPMLQSH
jgi:hypothetical protein